MRYAAALSQHPVPAHAVGEVAGSLLEQLDGEPPDLIVYFASPQMIGALEDMHQALRRLLLPTVLLGATASAVIGGPREAEDVTALSAWAACLDGRVSPVSLGLVASPQGSGISGWPGPGDGVDEAHTLLLLADPFTFPVEAFLARLEADHPGLVVIGGLASAAQGPGGNRLALDVELRSDGAVGVLLAGTPTVRAVVSQGCRPVGSAYIVTDAEDGVIRELGGRSALERLAEVSTTLTDGERELFAHGLHIGLVLDEHQAEFGRGDFLVRNVLGARREDGALTVGSAVSVGQTVQFHVRDALAADEDLHELLAGARAESALLFSCTGRGHRMFGVANHDAETVQELLGPLPVAGAFCAGEVGPVGGRNHVHTFTASLALFGG